MLLVKPLGGYKIKLLSLKLNELKIYSSDSF